ncbi:hypothetical protein [Mycoplana ramosa]|uniref:Uncharacterized protein n=1 Tax=Mycoplana ramosa TaxID=40837 RepID=A0ABW3Z2C4_MYCRA
MLRYFDRIAQFTATAGQGTITLGTAINNSMLTLAEAGAVDGNEITYLLEEGDDFEIGRGVVGDGATTVTRAAVQTSKIGGVVGANRMELAGGGRFRVVETADTFNRFENNIGYQALLPEIIKTASWAATIAEAGKMLVYNSAAGGTVTLPPAAASNGEAFHYRAAGNGALTIDPNGAETIEGAATLVLPRGCSALVWTNEGKTAWRAMVLPPQSIARLAGLAGSFQRFTGADTAVMQAIVGPVSQSGGVPTGAIVERGSNANGEYVRFADGTQICSIVGIKNDATLAQGSLFRSNAGATWTFPAAFSTTAGLSVSGTAASGVRWISSSPVSVSSVSILHYQATSSAAMVDSQLSAIGRWF